MAIRILRPNLDENRRILVISDIFGNFDALQRLLQKASYTHEDYLILLGNLVERGPQSLQTLRYVMELSRSRRVFCVTGDLDPVCREIFRPDRNRELLQYVLRNPSLVRDMCTELGIALNPDMNMHPIKLALRDYYAEELAFMSDLPHVIETPQCILKQGIFLRPVCGSGALADAALSGIEAKRESASSADAEDYLCGRRHDHASGRPVKRPNHPESELGRFLLRECGQLSEEDCAEQPERGT